MRKKNNQLKRYINKRMKYLKELERIREEEGLDQAIEYMLKHKRF